LQEFNIQKLNLVEAEKVKIRKEYERKDGQVEVKKRMCVPVSTPLMSLMLHPPSTKRCLESGEDDANHLTRPLCSRPHSSACPNTSSTMS
jgi:hypothetical protein